MKKFISKLLIGTMCICSLNGLVYAKSMDVDFFLKEIATTDNTKAKEKGMDMLNRSINDGKLDVESLKSKINAAPSIYEQALKLKGYSKEDVFKSLDNFKDISQEDTKKMMDAIKNQNLDEMKNIASKYDKNSSNTGSSSSSQGSSSSSSTTNSNQTSVTSNIGTNQSSQVNTTTAENKVVFKDLNNHWAKGDIEFLVSKGIIKGQSEQVFNPDGKITRAEFIQIIVRVLDLKEKEGSAVAFKDINTADWYYTAVKIGNQNGIINGIDSESFAPNKQVTREEMITIIIRAIQNKTLKVTKENSITIDSFKDKDNVSNWAVENINKALKMNIIKGKEEALFDSKGIATRAEAASTIKRVFDLIN